MAYIIRCSSTETHTHSTHFYKDTTPNLPQQEPKYPTETDYGGLCICPISLMNEEHHVDKDDCDEFAHLPHWVLQQSLQTEFWWITAKASKICSDCISTLMCQTHKTSCSCFNLWMCVWWRKMYFWSYNMIFSVCVWHVYAVCKVWISVQKFTINDVL